MKMITRITLLITLLASAQPSTGQSSDIHIRINQVGYLPAEYKEAVVFAESAVRERFDIVRLADGQVVRTLKASLAQPAEWGTLEHHATIDFTDVAEEGRYVVRGRKSQVTSQPFSVSNNSYEGLPDRLLEFMRQQRCGYNPFLDMVCHQRDGRSMYGPMPDSTFVDVSGGWHDAGDQLKYLITGSYATGHMLMAYELYPQAFGDKVNALGQPGANGIPDVLDEAKWGLDWLLKMHPAPDQLIHQVADDRDHRGWKMPDQDISEYGWGVNSYRVVYFATGKPQGLREYKSQATGFANLAGRSAAALALGARIWRDVLGDVGFAEKCLQAAISVYELGRQNEGYQQGNSYGAPYRYNEETWADDMEWGAAELLRTTGIDKYRTEARDYAKLANTVSWMNLDSAAHYQYYPFINPGHFALYDQVDEAFQDTLAGYYLDGIQYTFEQAGHNPYGIGIPFIWCSNNLLTSLIAQLILYERMTGDSQYREFLIRHRDWLLGRNPWGTSMFTGIPSSGEYPIDVHTSVWALTQQEVPGGLVDGPIWNTIYSRLKGLVLHNPDEFAHLQNEFVVYHDDIGDYSTNEPTMDGTAGAILMMAYWALAEQ